MSSENIQQRLRALIIEAKLEDPERGSFTEFLAEYLAANDVTIQKHARWIEDVRYSNTPSFKCSNCGWDTSSMTNGCPHCLAKMDGKGEGE